MDNCNCKELSSCPVNEDFMLRYGQIFQGESAYQQAKKGGYTGTEEQFMSLLGQVNKIDTLLSVTPSGDPLHDAYVSAGATWVASRQTWTVNTVEGITNNEMRMIYNRGFITPDVGQLAGSDYQNPSAIRVNLRSISSLNYSNNIIARNLAVFARGNTVIEIINLSGGVVGTTENIIGVTSLYYAFNGCSKLRRINGIIEDYLSGDISSVVFSGCTSLETLKIRLLKHNASFQDSPLLSQASILYMIKNAAPTSAIVITLHPTAYAMAMEDSEIQAALTAQPLVTLASA